MVENFHFFFVYTFRRIYTKGTRKLTAAPLSWQVHAEASRNSAPELSLESARFGVNRSHVCRPPGRLQPTVSGQKQRRGGGFVCLQFPDAPTTQPLTQRHTHAPRCVPLHLTPHMPEPSRDKFPSTFSHLCLRHRRLTRTNLPASRSCS